MSDPTRTPECPSELALDRLMAGELAEGAASAARTHLDGCARCATRMAAFAADRDAFRADTPPLVRPAAPAPARPWTERLRRWFLPVGGLAVAAAAVILFLVLPRGGEQEPGDGGTRIKGSERLGVYVKRGEVVSRLASGDVVHPSDELVFTTTTSVPRFVVVIGRTTLDEGGGSISPVFPDAESAVEVPAGVDAPLPGGFELDDEVLRTEEFFGFFCDRAVLVAELSRALVGRGEPRVEGCTVDRVALEKRAP